jgi:hypothetical protein
MLPLLLTRELVLHIVVTKRLQLIFTVEARDPTTLKDALISNSFTEKDESNEYAYKRPGRKAELTGAGTANGMFIYGANLYSWDSSRSNTNPVITLVSTLT